mgnify:FL=1
MDLTKYVLQYENGIFVLGQVPEDILKEMKSQFKFNFTYGLYGKTAYYVKTEGSHTYLREW